MKPDEIHWNDWLRIVFGEVPAEFYLELAIRGALVYLLLLMSMRLLGKRMAGQLSRLDLTAMTALASSIGVSMLSPVNGLLPPIMIAMIIVSITKLIYFLSARYEKVESFTQGNLDTLVENGILHLDRMKRVRVTKERLFAELRSMQIENLGKVDRMYMEADGQFSVLRLTPAAPGLLVLPHWDEEFIQVKTITTDKIICHECGAPHPASEAEIPSDTSCGNCGATKWTRAILAR